ncbi:RNA polymerase III subunit C82 [Amphichorda felina]
MLVTKHAAELCALLVNDLHGELPSRILIALLTKGRSTVPQLGQHTSLNPRQLRNGLAVLFQQNLLYTRTDPDTKITTYDANPDACYSLVRSGKILEAIDRQFGPSERELVQTLLQLGHARIHDLSQAFASRNHHANGNTNGSHNGARISSTNDLLVALGRLIQADVIETVRPESFRNPVDVFHEIKHDVTKTAPGEKSTKTKTEQHEQILNRWRAYREQGKGLKRQLDQTRGSSAKRRKLYNGRAANGDFEDESVPQLSPNIIVRVNHERCLVELRNRKLAEVAADALGEVTGEIYHTLLSLLTVEFAKCRPDSLVEDDTPDPQLTVTTLDILDHLDDSVNVSIGIGKVSKDKLNVSSAEKLRAAPPQSDDESDNSDIDEPVPRPARPMGSIDDDDSDEEEDDDDSDEEDDIGQQRSASSLKANGGRQTKVKFKEEAAPPLSRLDQMRQHLLLLKESKHQFIRHCGTQGRGQWTVDFKQLMHRLRDIELDAFIEQAFDRHGLRLTRILREKGKLDEKMLHTAALMKKSEVQEKMLAMQMAGVVDIQEVPKDSSRLANRTMFFWYFDGDRAEAQLLDDLYKTMVRCLQTLEVQRHKEKNILSFVERKDVQGKEEEVMTAEHYNKYNQHLEVVEKLLGQVMRLDDMVGVFRDF